MRPKEMLADTFDWQMRLMAEAFNVLPLSEACRCIKNGELPTRAACITFDDGYADNAGIALPILQRYGLPATFFVATGFLSGGRMWNDTVIEVVRRLTPSQLDLSRLGLGDWTAGTVHERYQTAMSVVYKLRYMDYDERRQKVAALASLVDDTLPADLMMTKKQVRDLVDRGMEVGAHTVSHPVLARLDDRRAVREIRDSKEELEVITGKPVMLFAYPNGRRGRDYGPRHVEMVREAGFSAAVCTQWGSADGTTDPYQLPRFTPWHRTKEMFHLALSRNYLRRRR